MNGYVFPEIKSYTSEEIRELIGPAEMQYSVDTQYVYSFNEDLPLPETPWICFDQWYFDAAAGTKITVTATPAATLDVILAVHPLSGPYLINVNANGPGGIETGSAVIPSTGRWFLSVVNPGGGSGSYTLTIISDKPLTNFVFVFDDLVG